MERRCRSEGIMGTSSQAAPQLSIFRARHPMPLQADKSGYARLFGPRQGENPQSASDAHEDVSHWLSTLKLAALRGISDSIENGKLFPSFAMRF